MRSEHLQGCLREVTRKNDQYTQQRKKLVSLTRLEFQEERLLVSLIWMTMVLLPKSVDYYRGILVVEVICKLCQSIMNNQLNSSITLHDALHIFRQGRGTGTKTFKDKLYPQLVGL